MSLSPPGDPHHPHPQHPGIQPHAPHAGAYAACARPLRARSERAGRPSGSPGFPPAGNRTIACGSWRRAIIARGRFCYWLDGDNIRLGLGSDLGFSAEDRHENIRRIGEVAKLFADSGVITLTSFISPYRADRDRCRAMHESGHGGSLPFLEVFVDTPIEVCEEAATPRGSTRRPAAGQLPPTSRASTTPTSPRPPPISCSSPRR